MLTCSLVVLNYNGKDLLKKYMPSVLRAAAESRVPCKAVVLDNQSTDGSAEFLQSEFPQAHLISAKQNRVLCSYNEYAREATEDIIILINNDMELLPGFVDPLVECFERDPDVFFAATEGDCPRASWRWGLLSAELDYPGYRQKCPVRGVSFSAGVGAFDRRKFLELGGYDPLYLPGRYEDVDLCYRGWKRGWKGLYAPQSRKIHEGGTSFDRAFAAPKTQAMVFRNGILFMIKNIQDGAWTARWLLMLPLRLAAATLRGQWFVWNGFAGAIRRLPAALRARKIAAQSVRISDRAALERAGA